MHLPSVPPARRQESEGGSNNTAVIVSLAVVAAAVLSFLFYVSLRNLRGRSDQQPSFYRRWLPGWTGLGEKRNRRTNNDHLEPISETSTNTSRSRRGRNTSADASLMNSTRGVEEGARGVDRNTSVRSVMTLPPYMQAPRDNEQVLGREGERGGVDTVLQFPDIAEAQEEERREEEMEALYQVRLARRAEIAEREERRRLRREAQEHNDAVALAELRARERARASSNISNTDVTSVEALRAEHERIKTRPRAVSSVSYGDLGVVTHDGTRLRANSEESERPLLGDAASIAASTMHTRNRSASSVLSIDTMNSDLPSPGFTRSRANSRPESPLRRVSTQGTQGQMSSPELIDAEQDLGEEEIPLNSPPEYETITLEDGRGAPPEYASPVQTRNPEVHGPDSEEQLNTVSRIDARGVREDRRSSRGVGGVPQLPSLRLSALPSIVVEGATPVSSRSEDPPPAIRGRSTSPSSEQ